MIIPACVMAVFLTLALCPDMAMKPVVEENPGEDEAWILPGSYRQRTSAIDHVRPSQAGPITQVCWDQPGVSS